MSDTDLSIESISARKLENFAEEAQVSVLKSILDQEANIAATLIESAAQAMPPGKGGKLNIIA